MLVEAKDLIHRAGKRGVAPRERLLNLLGVPPDQPEIKHRPAGAQAPLFGRFGALPRFLGRLGAGVFGEEFGHLLGLLSHHDVLGHDVAGEAAVANRIKHLFDRLPAVVEVRRVGLDAVLNAGGRALGAHHAERVAAGAVVAEDTAPE